MRREIALGFRGNNFLLHFFPTFNAALKVQRYPWICLAKKKFLSMLKFQLP